MPVPVRTGSPVAVDPVCGAEVELEAMAGELIHDGDAYRFCSLECARRFATLPERYAGESAPSARRELGEQGD